MALSRELLKRLNTAEEPLQKRLKLAENAFCKLDLPITRKEDVIVQWICNTCLINESAWPSLRYCLKSDQFNVKQDIKDSIVSVLVQKLNQHADHLNANVMECCTMLLTNISMQQYFVNKPGDLGLLVQSMLNCVQRIMRSVFNFKIHYLNEGLNESVLRNSDKELSLVAYNNAVIAIECVLQIYKSSSSTKEELKSIFIRDILYPLCAIVDHSCANDTNRLSMTATKCTQYIVFGRRKYLKGIAEDVDKMPFAGVFIALAEGSKNRTLKSNLVTFLLVFRAAIAYYKTEPGMLDLIFRNLVESAGQYKIKILCILLPHLSDISFDFENKIKDQTLSEFFQKIVEEILSTEDLINTDCEVLTEISNLNPLLIERNMHDILKLLFLQRKSVEQSSFFIAILNASIKLRRSQKLISMLLMALKEVLTIEEHYMIKEQTCFPPVFMEKFTNSLGNTTTAQQVVMMRTLTHYLKTDCMNLLKSNVTGQNTLMLKSTVELLIAFFNGIHVFEYSGALEQHLKFVNAFEELGIILSLLVDKALHLSHIQDIIVILLSGVLSWSEVYSMLKYYVPKTLTDAVKFPIMEESWQQLIERVKNFGENNCKNIMNDLILRRLKESLLNKPSIKLKTLIGGIEYSWGAILKFNTEIVSCLNNKDVSTMARLLLTDMISNETSLTQWAEVIRKENLQENKRFTICILNHVLTDIGSAMPPGMTQSITKHINVNMLLEIENMKNENREILQSVKKELLKENWRATKSSLCNKIERFLEILLCLPLTVMSVHIRTLTFLVVYALKKECSGNNAILSLSDKILSDLSERTNADIFLYIDVTLLINEFSQNKALLMAYEQVLRNTSSYDTLRKFLKSCKYSTESMYMLLERFDNVRSKLDSNQKSIFQKAENKLSKMLLDALPTDINKTREMKSLTFLLKIAISNNTIDETLTTVTNSALCNIFKPGNVKNINTGDNLTEEGFKLVLIILQSKKILETVEIPVKQVWEQMLKSPYENLLLPLLAYTKPKEFQELLQHLQSQTIRNLSEENETLLANDIIIWNAVLKVNMSAQRNKLRLGVIDNILRNVQDLRLSEKSSLYFLKFLQNILSAKHLYVPGNIIDMSICISLKSLDPTKMCIYNDVLTLCGILIKTRSSLITDRLPTLLLLYRRTINLIVRTSKCITSKEEEHYFKCLALDFEKLTNALTKLKKDIVRLSPYLIADFLQLFSENTAPPFVKVSLENCVGQLISICDQHGIALLSRTLSESMQEVFKIQLDTYNKFHKFSGKI